MSEPTSPSGGPAVDAHGSPVVDPTKNVLDLFAAGMKRQDDLREMESLHMRETAALRAHYENLLREAETKRIDAIRAVDVSAVARAAEVSSQQASTLAAQVALTAETARAGLATALQPITLAIEALRAAQYAQQGQQAAKVDQRADKTETGESARWIVTTLVAGGAALLTYLSTHGH